MSKSVIKTVLSENTFLIQNWMLKDYYYPHISTSVCSGIFHGSIKLPLLIILVIGLSYNNVT